MLLPRALLAPHLPTLVLDQQRGHYTPMIAALRLEAARLAAERPDALIVVDARWDTAGPFQVDTRREHRTITDAPDLGVEIRYGCPGHPELGRALVEAGRAAGMRVGSALRDIDLGVSVPLHFLLPSRAVPVVPVSVPPATVVEARAWGGVLRDVLLARPERVGIVIGGMLSHATHAWQFRRAVPEAQRLDQAVLAALREGRWDVPGPAEQGWLDKAQPEAGLLHLQILRGLLGRDVPGDVLCHEQDCGVGAAVVAFEVPGGERVGPPPEEIVVAPEAPWPPVAYKRVIPKFAPRNPRPRPAGPRRAGVAVSAGRRKPTSPARPRGPRPGPKRRG